MGSSPNCIHCGSGQTWYSAAEQGYVCETCKKIFTHEEWLNHEGIKPIPDWRTVKESGS